MTKEIDVEEAASWDEDEFKYNVKYLEDRSRFAEADRARNVRGGTAFNLSSANAREVADWVGEDKERAQQALDEEGNRDEPRKGLTEHLEKLVSEA